MKVEDDPSRLGARYADWPTRKLVLALREDQSGYGPAARTAMLQALEFRGVGLADWEEEVGSIATDAREAERDLDRVRGFLLLLVVFVVLRSLLQVLGAQGWLAAPLWRLRLAGLLGVGLGLYGLRPAAALTRKHPAAPLRTKIWLVGSVVVEVVRAAALYTMAGEFPAGSEPSIDSALTLAAVGVANLTRSRRVAIVYGGSDGAGQGDGEGSRGAEVAARSRDAVGEDRGGLRE